MFLFFCLVFYIYFDFDLYVQAHVCLSVYRICAGAEEAR